MTTVVAISPPTKPGIARRRRLRTKWIGLPLAALLAIACGACGGGDKAAAGVNKPAAVRTPPIASPTITPGLDGQPSPSPGASETPAPGASGTPAPGAKPLSPAAKPASPAKKPASPAARPPAPVIKPLVPGPVPPGAAPPASGAFKAGDCVSNYDGRDLFPVKSTFRYAGETLGVEYRKSYKVLTVKKPWPETTTPLRYVLVQCGTPAPALTGDLAGATMFEVPIRRAAVMTTTVLPYFELFDAVPRLASVSEFKQVNTAPVVQAIQDKKIIETGQNEKANLEVLTALNPDVVITVKQGDPAGLERLRQAGFKVLVNGSQSEDQALGRTENEMKFMAALLNREGDAERAFNDIDTRYTALARSVANVATKPTIYAGHPSGATWTTPGGKHWQAQLFRDAGGDYLFKDEASRGSLPLTLEAVLGKAANADYWFQSIGKPWESLADAKAEEPRITNFTAFREGRFIGLRTFQVKDTGADDFWEQGVSRPDLLLQDIISLIHPELGRGYAVRFYRVLR